MIKELKCPMCGEALHKLACENPECSFSEDYTLLANRTTFEDIISTLVAAGAYINKSTEVLVIPGETVDSRFSLHTERAASFASFLRTAFGFTSKAISTDTALACLHRIRQERTSIPKVYSVGDYPLMDRINGNLQHIGANIYKGYYYYGPELEPRDHGGIFEDWVDSFRWATEGGKQLLRAWLLSLFAQRMVQPGRFPALVLATYEGSSVGKTETANMISTIFGRMMWRFWDNNAAQNADRELLTGEHRFFCADNLVPSKRGIVEGGRLSEFITKGQWESKQLYSTGGTARATKTNVDILTANFPILSLDLLQRVVTVGLVNKPVEGSGDWVGYWAGRRRELLEEGLYIVQENSKNRPEVSDPMCGYSDFRYPHWYTIAVECSGELFSPYAERCVSSPLDIMVSDEVDDLSLEDFTEEIKAAQGLVAKMFQRQVGNVTKKKVKSIIERWSTKFRLEEKENRTWIKRS